MKRILLFGYYGYGNFGDDLILETLTESLSDRFRVSAVSFSDRHSRKTRALIEQGRLNLVPIKVIARRPLSRLNFLYQILQAVRAGRRHEVLVFGGGTQLFETPKNGILPLLTHAVFTTVLQSVFGKRVGHLFVGINEPQTHAGAFLLRRILAASDFVVLRDRRSYDVCRAAGANEDKLRLAADTAYLRMPAPPRSERASEAPTRIGLSLFPYFGSVARAPQKDAEYLSQTKKVLAEFGRRNLDSPPSLVFFGSQPDTNLDDIEYARKIAPQLGGGDHRFVDYGFDTEEMLSELGRIGVLVAMRLHLIIAATLAGVPRILVLPYQDKVVEEAKSLGLPIIGDKHSEGGPTISLEALARRRVLCLEAIEWMERCLEPRAQANRK